MSVVGPCGFCGSLWSSEILFLFVKGLSMARCFCGVSVGSVSDLWGHAENGGMKRAKSICGNFCG